MFTGIIRHSGVLTARDGKRLTVSCPALAGQIVNGDSVAVNGVCLTALEADANVFAADLLDETLAHTTLGELPVSANLNLELPLTAGQELGGHWLQGHVDGTTRLLELVPRGNDEHLLTFALPTWLRPWAVEKGSIAIDGISLTLQTVTDGAFAVGIIPATWAATNLRDRIPGDKVNIEADYLVKTVRKALEDLLPAMLADRGQHQSQAAS